MTNAGLAVLYAGLVAGCGDNQPLCDYREAADATNDQTAESTGLTAGTRSIGLCGSVDGGHYDARLATVDLDRFQITIAGSGDLAVQLVADAGVALLRSLAVSIFTDAPNPALVAAGRFDPALGDHGAFRTVVPPGDYLVEVAATAGGDLSGSLDYRVELVPDPAARCPADLRGADYTESGDGADATGNDVFEVDFGKTPPIARVSGTAEATALAIDLDASYRISGTATTTAATASHADEYLDRDTYAVATTGATTELTIRLDWTDPAADLDFIVFEAATGTPIAIANLTSTTGPELAVVAVKPATSYLVWVGSFMGSSNATPYDLTLCGAHFLH